MNAPLGLKFKILLYLIPGREQEAFQKIVNRRLLLSQSPPALVFKGFKKRIGD